MGRRVDLLDPDALKTALLAFALVCVIGIGVAILDRVRRATIKPEDDPRELLASLEEAHEAGEIDEAEFRRVREVIDRNAQFGPDGKEPRIPK